MRKMFVNLLKLNIMEYFCPSITLRCEKKT
jgi:hypothetical protein